MSPGFLGGQLTLAFVDSAESSASTITVPAAALQGDIAYLCDRGLNGAGLPSTAIPSGFASIINTTAGTVRRQISSVGVLGAAPGGTSLTGMNADSSNRKMILVFRPSRALASPFPVLLSTWLGEGTDGDPASQAVSAAGVTSPLIVIGAYGTGGGTAAFNTATPAFDATFAHTSGALIVGYKIYNMGPYDHAIDAADTGTGNILQSGYLRAIG